jgi:hypothetical protein
VKTVNNVGASPLQMAGGEPYNCQSPIAKAHGARTMAGASGNALKPITVGVLTDVTGPGSLRATRPACRA